MGGPVDGPRVYDEIHAFTISNVTAVVEPPRAMIGALAIAVNTLIDAPYRLYGVLYSSASATSVVERPCPAPSCVTR